MKARLIPSPRAIGTSSPSATAREMLGGWTPALRSSNARTICRLSRSIKSWRWVDAEMCYISWVKNAETPRLCIIGGLPAPKRNPDGSYTVPGDHLARVKRIVSRTYLEDFATRW